MAEPSDSKVELKVGAHVLVQLGSELVTDVEQAILECVKNAYDADAPGCLIEVETGETGVMEETGPINIYRGFDRPSESVSVEFVDEHDDVLDEQASKKLKNASVTRKLSYTGRISIEDKGDGIASEDLQDSWLAISRSAKRGKEGTRKNKTKKGRTPLGDKGLGRLGSMKLGDILRIETATSVSSEISVAQFRWTDCETARTVDEIPVFLDEIANTEKFKGTRISILGLKDIAEWKRKNRALEISGRLAQLISPFESTSTFPVGFRLDGDEQSLVSMTEEALGQAVSQFEFRWQDDDADPATKILVATARFRKRLFMPTRGREGMERANRVFGYDNGAGFAEELAKARKLKAYRDKKFDVDGAWYIELTRIFQWSDLEGDRGEATVDPGAFSGALYFFHLDKLGEINDEESPAPGKQNAVGLGVSKNLIRNMSGVSILRDGFRVRTPR